jgi:hypothetical protein
VRETNRVDLLIEDEGDPSGCFPIDLDSAIWPTIQSYVINQRLAGSTTGPTVETSAHKGIRNITLAAAATRNDNLDLTFAGIARLTADATGSVVTGIAGGYPGRVVYFPHVAGAGNITWSQNDSNSLAQNRLRCANAMSIVQSPFEAVVGIYGIGPSIGVSTGSWVLYKIGGAHAIGTFTGTLTGVVSGSGTIEYSVNGDLITLQIPAILGESNSTACTITGIPSTIRPANTQTFHPHTQDSGVEAPGKITISSAGVITLYYGIGTTFTNDALQKGITACSVTYRKS